MMIFFLERYYEKQPGFSLKKAIFESAKIVSRWANTYDIGYPGSYHREKNGYERIESGTLPDSQQRIE